MFESSIMLLYIVVWSPTDVWFVVTPWIAAHQASLSFTFSRSLPKFMSIASVMPSSHLILWRPLLLLPSVFPSIRDFSNESAYSHQMTKILEFQHQHQSFQSIQGWFPLRLTGLISLLSKGLSGVFSSTVVWRHQFFGAPPSLWSSFHNCAWPLGKS